jgi:hypothetical protein
MDSQSGPSRAATRSGTPGNCASPRPDGLIEQHADLGETAAGQRACRNYAIDAPQPYHLHGTQALWLNLP